MFIRHEDNKAIAGSLNTSATAAPSPPASSSNQYPSRAMQEGSHRYSEPRPTTMWSMMSDLSLCNTSRDETFAVELPPPAPTATVPTRDSQFWLYDGSIIFHVENTLFRVHQTILANHSDVFKDLFMIPQPDGEDTMEGCHVVHLHDKVDDFTDLLRAVYVPDHFDAVTHDSTLESILSFIGGILRLSTKYMIRYLRQRCIPLLVAKIPNTFVGYEAKSLSQHERFRSDTLMRAINLAKDNDVLEVLPYAYYCLSRFPHKRFLKDRPGDISWRDKMIVLIGRERLQWAQMSLSHKFLLVFQRAPTCQSPLCAHTRSPHAEWHEIEKGGAHPLKAYEGWNGLNICSACVEYSQVRHLEGRKEVWRLMPTWFELPSWEDLKTIQNS